MNIYDFDGTLYAGDSTVDFLLFSFRKHPALLRFLPIQGIAFFKYYVLKATDKTAMKEQFYRVFSGYDPEALLEEFWDTHQHKIFPWYAGQQEPEDIIISASPEFLLRPICARLGIRHLIASRVDSRTGRYQGKNCHGAEKVVRLKQELGYDHCTAFYSDSYSDTPLAEIADKAYLVKKDGTVVPWGK